MSGPAAHVDWRYTTLMVLALVVAAVLLRRRQQRLPLSAWQRLAIGIGAFCGAMFGAKLPFVLTDPAGMASGVAWLRDGKTIVFGLVGGYLGVEIGKWALQIKVKTGDSYVVPVAVAIAIGRLACFQAGCCYGRPTALPWGVDFGDGPRHPTQWYEALFHLAAALCAVLVLERREWLTGQRIKLYILAYLAYRFASEYLRPEPELLWGLSVYQVATLAIAPLFVWLWIHDARQFAMRGGKENDTTSTIDVEQQWPAPTGAAHASPRREPWV